MKRVLTAAVLIPFVLLAVWKAAIWLLAILVAIVVYLAVNEYRALAIAYGFNILRWPVYIASALCLAALCSLDVLGPLRSYSVAVVVFSSFLMVGLSIAVIALLVLAMRESDLSKSLPSAALSVFGIVYVAVPMSFVVFLRLTSEGAFVLAWVFLVVWCGDILAFYVGRKFGKHKVAPQISPAKSYEGSIASFLAAVGIGVGFVAVLKALQLRLEAMPSFHYMESVDFANYLVVALGAALINVAAQLGDFVESMLKRGAGVKDSGSLLPGHGGVLDRIDALLFALPIAVLVFLLIPPFGIPN